MSWSPDPQALEQLKHIFQGTLSPNNNDRRLANEALTEAKQQEEIENYLLYLLIYDSNTKSDVRAAAGINLKNHILKTQKQCQQRQYILTHVLQGIMSNESLIRNITGNVITSLFSKYGLSQWPEILTNLIEIINNHQQNHIQQESALSALSKICEDSKIELDQEIGSTKPSNYIISNLLRLLNQSNNNKLISNSIHCINQFISLNTQSFLTILDEYLMKLFEIAQTNHNNEVSKNICQSFLLILESRPEKLQPHLDGVINYCLHLMQLPDSPEVSLEACEFLLALSTAKDMRQIFTNEKIKLILPILLDRMVYSEEDIVLIEIADAKDDSNVQDKDEDVKPANVKSKETKNNGISTDKKLKNGYESDSESDLDDDDDSDFEDNAELNQWSLRKCSAATLDVLSENLPQEVLIITLPILQEKIISKEWPIREAAILAFGAMSQSFIQLARQNLPDLVPFLVDRLQDQEPRVRQITCWTLSRYSCWVSEEAHEGGQYANYFHPTFQSIITCALDSKKIVQEAACSALSSFIEESESNLLFPFLEPLLNLFNKCLQTYQRKNFVILYDCIQTFVEKMGYETLSSKQEYIEVLLPPLLKKWEQLNDDDNDLWPLLECMASIAATLKELFAPFAVPVYDRAVKILSNCILLDQECLTNPSIEAPEKDFMVTSLDLIDGLIQGFEYHSIDLIHQNQTSNLIDLLLVCFEDYNGDVRQSAFALLGDLAIFTIDLIKPPSILNQIILIIGNEINNRSYETYPVYNNAIWALGEILIRLPSQDEQFKQYLDNLINLLIPIINSNDIQSTVVENAAICLGRMGINGAHLINNRVPEFIIPWCQKFLTLVDNNEKESGFVGMIQMINLNPDNGFGGLQSQQGLKNLACFLTCIATYEDASESLQGMFLDLVSNYKQLLGENVWKNQVLNYIDPKIRDRLLQI